MIVPVVLVQS